jgi:hypothetical protein
MRSGLHEDSSTRPRTVGGDRIVPPRLPPDPDVLPFADGEGRERVGWVRGIVITVVVAIATAAVVLPTGLILRRLQHSDAAGAPAPVVAPSSAGPASPSPAAAVADAPSAPPATAAPPPDPTPTPAATSSAPPVRGSGRAASGDVSVSFLMATADLHAQDATTVTVSGTGTEDDRVSGVSITLADGDTLATGSADGCSGPAFPWSQTFTITFPRAETTQLQVQLTTCQGGSLVATGVVDVQP